MGRRRKEQSPLEHHFKAIANHYFPKMQQVGPKESILNIFRSFSSTPICGFPFPFRILFVMLLEIFQLILTLW